MTVLDRVPLTAISARAAQIRFWPTVLSLLALPVMSLGFLVAGLWVALRWSCAAFMIGFDVARGPRPEQGNAVGRRRGPG